MIGVMPMPAEISTSGPGASSRTRSPNGAETRQLVPLEQVVVQEVRHLPGRDDGTGVGAAGRDGLDRDAPVAGPGRVGEAVLPDLAGPVGQRHLDRDVLAGPPGRQRAAVRGAEHERHGVRRLLQAPAQDQRAPDVAVGDAGLGVQALLDGDQGAGHVPVDLVPGRRHVGGDRVPEHLHDRREQVLVDDRVLVLGDAERGVLVRDAGQHVERVAAVLGHQQGGVRRDRAGEGGLLVALRLVAAVEEVPLELGVGGEHAPVEDRGDVTDSGADDGQRGLDDVGGPGGQHADSERV